MVLRLYVYGSPFLMRLIFVILMDYLAPPQLLSSIRLWLVLFVSTHYSILCNAQEPTYGDTLSDIACGETSRMFGTGMERR
jgi:hypothetical protein